FLKAYNFLLRFSSHLVSLKPILKNDSPGTNQTNIFKRPLNFAAISHPFLSSNPYLEPEKQHKARRCIDLLEEQLASSTNAEAIFDCLPSLILLRQTAWQFPRDLWARASPLNDQVDTELQNNKRKR